MSDMYFREPNQVKWMGSRPGHNGTQVLEHASATNATVIVYTVPGAHTLFLTHTILDIYSTGISTAYLSIYNAVPALVIHIHLSRVQTNRELSLNNSYWPPIEIPAAYSVRVQSSAATNIAEATIHGWVE